jgi:hypothetical protein
VLKFKISMQKNKKNVVLPIFMRAIYNFTVKFYSIINEKRQQRRIKE